MTTEDEFQAAIDAKPDDWQLRLRFADWLDSRNDSRAPGYRTLAMQHRRPLQGTKEWQGKTKVPTWWWHCPKDEANLSDMYNHLPRDWFDLFPEDEGNDTFWPVHRDPSDPKSRRECDDAAAFAFLRLPYARRLELLTTPNTLNSKL